MKITKSDVEVEYSRWCGNFLGRFASLNRKFGVDHSIIGRVNRGILQLMLERNVFLNGYVVKRQMTFDAPIPLAMIQHKLHPYEISTN